MELVLLGIWIHSEGEDKHNFGFQVSRGLLAIRALQSQVQGTISIPA